MPIIISGCIGKGEDLLMFSDMMKIIWTAQNAGTQAAFLNSGLLCQKKNPISVEKCSIITGEKF